MKKTIFATIVAVSVLFSVVASAGILEDAKAAKDVVVETAGTVGQTVAGTPKKVEEGIDTLSKIGCFFKYSFWDYPGGKTPWGFAARILTIFFLVIMAKRENETRTWLTGRLKSQGLAMVVVTLLGWLACTVVEGLNETLSDTPPEGGMMKIWAMVAGALSVAAGIHWVVTDKLFTRGPSGLTSAGLQMPVPPTPPPAQTAAVPQAAAPVAAVALAPQPAPVLPMVAVAPQPATPAFSPTCPKCGARKTGPFCTACGTKEPSPQPRSFSRKLITGR